MNLDPRFVRVRARTAWLPLLAETNPAVAVALARLASQASDWREVIDARARELLGEAPSVDAATLAQAPAAIAAHALLVRARAAGLELADDHVRAIVGLAGGPARGTRVIDLPGGHAIRRYDTVEVVAREPSAAPPGPSPAPRILDHHGDSLIVRHRQPGDRMRPARLRGHSRSLAQLLADAKVPAPLRPHAWVATSSAGEIVWAEHIGAAYAAEVTVADASSPQHAAKAAARGTSQNLKSPSFPRRRESSPSYFQELGTDWVAACAGTTGY